MENTKADDWRRFSQSGHKERIAKFHELSGEPVEDLNRHVFLHLAIENQLAMGNASVKEALKRLMSKGMDRHQAIHKIGTIYLKYEIGMPRPHPDSIDFQAYEFELSML